MVKDPSSRASVLQHVSHNVRRLRQAAGLSQSALAECSGVSRRMLVAIEAGSLLRDLVLILSLMLVIVSYFFFSKAVEP